MALPDPNPATVEALVGSGASRAAAWTAALGDGRWQRNLGIVVPAMVGGGVDNAPAVTVAPA